MRATSERLVRRPLATAAWTMGLACSRGPIRGVQTERKRKQLSGTVALDRRMWPHRTRSLRLGAGRSQVQILSPRLTRKRRKAALSVARGTLAVTTAGSDPGSNFFAVSLGRLLAGGRVRQPPPPVRARHARRDGLGVQAPVALTALAQGLIESREVDPILDVKPEFREQFAVNSSADRRSLEASHSSQTRIESASRSSSREASVPSPPAMSPSRPALSRRCARIFTAASGPARSSASPSGNMRCSHCSAATARSSGGRSGAPVRAPHAVQRGFPGRRSPRWPRSSAGHIVGDQPDASVEVDGDDRHEDAPDGTSGGSIVR